MIFSDEPSAVRILLRVSSGTGKTTICSVISEVASSKTTQAIDRGNSRGWIRSGGWAEVSLTTTISLEEEVSEVWGVDSVGDFRVLLFLVGWEALAQQA